MWGRPPPGIQPGYKPDSCSLDPAKLVTVVRSRAGIKLDPSGVLWLELKRGESIPGVLRNVLLALYGQS